MTDTAKASVITDHPFEPRAMAFTIVVAGVGDYELPPNQFLCGYRQGIEGPCNMAEAAHRETTVKR